MRNSWHINGAINTGSLGVDATDILKSMTNYASGHKAERVAADFLQTQGYTILASNWRHKRAEIDIIAQLQPRWRPRGAIVFFEVKYRRTSGQGRGFDYITDAKLTQMQFAANLWMHVTDYRGACALGAIEVAGTDYKVVEWVTNIVI